LRVPSTKNSTRVTPDASDAFADIVAFPETIAPLVGDVSKTMGAVVSGVGVGDGVIFLK
jgi:hypothetical protein